MWEFFLFAAAKGRRRRGLSVWMGFWTFFELDSLAIILEIIIIIRVFLSFYMVN